MQEGVHTRSRKDQQPLLEGLPDRRGRRVNHSERENFPSPEPLLQTFAQDLEEMAEQPPPPRRTLGDSANTVGPLNFNSNFIPAENATNLVMSPALIQLVQSNQFHGLSSENPYKHLTIFGEICNTVKVAEVSDERIRLSLFPFSLGGNVKDWLYSFAEGTFRNWDALVKQFVTRFFPQTKIHQGKLEISSFKQGMEETLG